MLYVLYGEDGFSRQQALDEIKSTIGDETALATNTTVLEGQQATVDQIRTVAETMPFLAERRLVIIQGLLERFESRTKAGRRKKAAGVSSRQNRMSTSPWLTIWLRYLIAPWWCWWMER
ncbi:MAG: hypothetical protein GH158_06650 [Dehalococcoidia bacterium]|nr:hypothetical protein [Dehalococcoidia bacterium]